MKARVMIAGFAAALALAGSSLALGDGAERRVAATPVGQQAQQLPRSLERTRHAVGKIARVRVRCGTLSCVNGALTGLAKAFRKLTGCMSFINIGRYDGYVYSDDGGATQFLTTGLDEVPPGEAATKAAIFVC